MRVLLVHAHPVAESFNATLYKIACETLRAAGHDVRGIDLYAEDFPAIMTRQQRLEYHIQGANEAGLAPHIEALRWAEALIFIYPTWWYGLPAMLKGWLDRVWLPHVTFSMPEGNQPIRGLMTNIRWLGIITTYGSPWWWVQIVGDPGVRTLTRGIRALCHRRCRTFKLAHYKIDASTPETRARFMQQVQARLRRL